MFQLTVLKCLRYTGQQEKMLRNSRKYAMISSAMNETTQADGIHLLRKNGRSMNMLQLKKTIRGPRATLFLIPFTVLAFLLFLPVRSSACTGVYVGAEASSDGTILLGKSNDTQGVYPNHVIVEESIGKADIAVRLMPIDNAESVLAVVPETTYRYTCTPYMDYSIDRLDCGRDATVAANEKGVSMLISITAFTNQAALQADPLIDNGLTELTAAYNGPFVKTTHEKNIVNMLSAT